MVFKVLQESEAPLTVFTFKRLLASVDAYVFGEVTLVVEVFPALFAAVRFLPRVDHLVFLQVRGLRKILAALEAAVRFLRAPIALVIHQLLRLGEFQSAEGAAWWFLLVSGLVFFQIPQIWETFPALPARVRFLPRVAALVQD